MPKAPPRSLLRVAWGSSIGAAVAMRVWNALAGPMLHGYDGWSHVAYVLYLDLYHALPLGDQGWSYFHPPLHYLLGFLLAQVGDPEVLARGIALLGSLESLGVAALGAWLVRRRLPDPPWLSCLAFTVLAFLPVHVYASPMPGNEMLSTFLVAAAFALFLGDAAWDDGPWFRWRDVAVGSLLGLALLTKASALVGVAALLAISPVAAVLRRVAGSGLRIALGRTMVVAVVVAAIAAPVLWRNVRELGTPLPTNSHARQLATQRSQPPGVRGWVDFVALPGPALLQDSSFDAPHLVHSVWGTVYLNAWFDTFRGSQFPRFTGFGFEERSIHEVTLAMAAVGIAPTALAALGAWAMVGRARRVREVPDAVVDVGLLLLGLFALVFFVAFTIRVPTFAALKATYLLHGSLPFGWATAVAARWLSERGHLAVLWAALAAVGFAAVLTVSVFTSGMLYPMRPDHSDMHALRAYFGEPASARAWLSQPGVDKQRHAVELVAAVELGEGNYGRARELLAGVAGGSVSAQFSNALATASALAGDPAMALRIWDVLLGSGSSMPEALANRGAVRAFLGDLAGGRADVERALARSEAMAPAWRSLASIFRAKGREDDARAMRQRARELASSPPRGFPYGVGDGDLDFAGRGQRWLVELNAGELFLVPSATSALGRAGGTLSSVASAPLLTPDRRRDPAALGWVGLIVALFAGAIALRINNAYGLFVGHGFDETFNWEYVRQLTQSWALPHPESHWSAARPPLFFYVAGAIARVFGPMQVPSVHAIRLASSAFGVLVIAVGLWQLQRAAPGRDLRRVALAAGLWLFVPAHIYLSAMVNEEISVASWMTLALVLAVWEQRSESVGAASWLRVLAIGVVGGLAFLTKLTGCLVVMAIAASFVLDGWRRGDLRPAIARAATLSVVALVVGGWFYARSLVLYGYLYPHSLESHSIMLSMPPGERTILDYLQFSFSAFLDTRVDSPGLLHSVWGGTYVTWWFDGHRHFVPRIDPMVDRMGLIILSLAILPTAASVAGCARGIGRARRSARSIDAPMLSLLLFMLAGYGLYTWRNPWFACVKASYLLALGMPYAWWASERLAAWSRGPRWLGVLVWLDLVLLLAAIVAAFTFGTSLWTMTLGVHKPGLPWLPGQL